MGICPKAARQQLRQCIDLASFSRTGNIDLKIIVAKFPHYLPAYAAGRKCARDHAVFAAAHGNGLEIPPSVIDCLKKRSSFGAICGLY